MGDYGALWLLAQTRFILNSFHKIYLTPYSKMTPVLDAPDRVARKRGIEGHGQRQQQWFRSCQDRLVFGLSFLTEDDIPGNSLDGRDPNRLKNSEL